MGYLDRTTIERAARYLLSLFEHTPQIRYSEHFYDGTEETGEALRDALGLEDGWYSPELLVDVAASQLQAMGVVETKPLDERMADGEPDCEIRITDKGKAYTTGCKLPRFHDVHL